MNAATTLTDEELLSEMLARGIFSEDWYDYYYTFDKPAFDASFLNLMTEINAVAPRGLRGDDLNAWRGTKSSRVGAAFEALAQVILGMCKVVSYERNVHTSISEIDFLIRKNSQANLFDVLKVSNPFLLGEAKCYSNNRFDGDWVAKLRTRMDQHNVDLAILFVRAERSALSGKLHTNFIVNTAQKKYIIPLGLNCLNRIGSGENFLKLLTEHYSILKTYKPVAV